MKARCPKCGSTLRCNNRRLGDMIQCPSCTLRFPIMFDLDTLAPVAPPPVNIQGIVNTSAPRTRRRYSKFRHFLGLDSDRRSELDGEPWYYGYIDRYGKLLQFMALTNAGLFALLVTLSAIWAVWNAWDNFTHVIGMLLVWFILMVIDALALMVAMLGIAGVFLLVDSARNLRAIKLFVEKP